LCGLAAREARFADTGGFADHSFAVCACSPIGSLRQSPTLGNLPSNAPSDRTALIDRPGPEFQRGIYES
jgi:hypothetical protein